MSKNKIDVVLHHPDGRDERRRVTLMEASFLRAGSIPFDVFDSDGTMVASFFSTLPETGAEVTAWDGPAPKEGPPLVFDWAHTAKERGAIWDWLGVPRQEQRVPETAGGPFRVSRSTEHVTFAALCVPEDGALDFEMAIAWPEHVTMAQREEVVRRLCEQFGGSFFG